MATTKPKTAKPKTKKVPAKKRSKAAAQQQSSFFTFKFTYQSMYWLILCLLVLALGVWVISLSVKVQRIYDQIEMSNMSDQSIVITKD